MVEDDDGGYGSYCRTFNPIKLSVSDRSSNVRCLDADGNLIAIVDVLTRQRTSVDGDALGQHGAGVHHKRPVMLPASLPRRARRRPVLEEMST